MFASLVEMLAFSSTIRTFWKRERLMSVEIKGMSKNMKNYATSLYMKNWFLVITS
jgi:hypothetical protein